MHETVGGVNSHNERLGSAANELGIAIHGLQSAYRLSPAEMLMMINMATSDLLSFVLIAENNSGVHR